MARQSIFSSVSKSAAAEAKAALPPPFGSSGDVLFGLPADPNGQFSVEKKEAVVVGGLAFPSVEHFFQAMKFHGTRYVEVIRAAGSPSQARQAAGHDGALQYMRTNWREVKEGAMMQGLVAKFCGDETNVEKLLLTGDQRLVYTRRDDYWGVGEDGLCGRNRVGELLMRLRAAFKDGSCPKDGRCMGCRAEAPWVAPLTAQPYPYCSPACRVSLGLPEEPGKPDWIAEERALQLAEEKEAAAKATALEAKAAADAAAVEAAAADARLQALKRGSRRSSSASRK